ncbi:GNAT family N-acetyltransferase [bacterium]|nr:MAG: GNAT family N-acetyltransferase [bacterium]
MIIERENLIARVPKKNEYLKICRLLNRADKPYKKFIQNYEPFTVKDLEHMQSKSKKIFTVIELDSKIAGIGIWSIKNKKICWISLFHINPEKQRMGLGMFLLEAIEQLAKDKKCSLIMGEVFPEAQWAKNFYLKNGYTILPKKEYAKSVFKGLLSLKALTLVIIKKN